MSRKRYHVGNINVTSKNRASSQQGLVHDMKGIIERNFYGVCPHLPLVISMSENNQYLQVFIDQTALIEIPMAVSVLYAICNKMNKPTSHGTGSVLYDFDFSPFVDYITNLERQRGNLKRKYGHSAIDLEGRTEEVEQLKVALGRYREKFDSFGDKLAQLRSEYDEMEGLAKVYCQERDEARDELEKLRDSSVTEEDKQQNYLSAQGSQELSGEMLKQIRLERGLSLTKLGRELNLSPSTIRNAERGLKLSPYSQDTILGWVNSETNQ
ncbi:helix-turn-helix domain-containing protein [Nanoarchaeota archaeon]